MDSRRVAAWGAGVAVVAISLAAMAALWRGGGLQLAGAPTSAAVEACGARIEGSSTMTARLAPAIATAFLRQAGYAVEPPLPADEGRVIVIGRRGSLNCTVTIRASTSTDGLDALAAGQALLALSTRPISERDQLMLAAAGAGDFVVERAIAERQVGFDALAVVVNAANPLREMDLGRVRDMGTGALKSWSELGGADQPIHVFAPLDGHMPRDFPNDIVPVRHPFFERTAERIRLFKTDDSLALALREDVGGVALASAASFSGAEGLRILPFRNGPDVYTPTPEAIAGRRYPLVRRLFIYARPDDARDNAFVKSFVAFAASPEVDALVRNAGFFAIDRAVAGLADPVAGRCIMGSVEAAAVAGAIRGASRVGEPLRFQGNSLRLTDASRTSIEGLAPILAEQLQRGAAGILIGHADVIGESADNRQVALKRAIAVRDAFEAKGVVGLSTESAGEMCVGAENVSGAGRRSNQRVELWVRPPAIAARPT